MEHPFDRLARTLGEQRSRRAVLRQLGAAVVGAVVTVVLPRAARNATAFSCTGGPPCAAGCVDCGGGCADLLNDASNCGGCGQHVPPGGKCNNGQIQSSPAQGGGQPTSGTPTAGGQVNVNPPPNAGTSSCPGVGQTCFPLVRECCPGLTCLNFTCVTACAGLGQDCSTTTPCCQAEQGFVGQVGRNICSDRGICVCNEAQGFSTCPGAGCNGACSGCCDPGYVCCQGECLQPFQCCGGVRCDAAGASCVNGQCVCPGGGGLPICRAPRPTFNYCCDGPGQQCNPDPNELTCVCSGGGSSCPGAANAPSGCCPAGQDCCLHSVSGTFLNTCCPAGSVCNTQGNCVCPTGAICGLDARGVPGPNARCCPNGQVCPDGQNCVEACDPGHPCATGCCAAGTCVATCPTGFCCENGMCVSACTTGCCSGGACVSGLQSDTHCGPIGGMCQDCTLTGKHCVNGACIGRCDTTHPCPSGACCSNGTCVASAQCPNGGCCTNGVCGCPAGSTCTNHVCQNSVCATVACPGAPEAVNGCCPDPGDPFVANCYLVNGVRHCGRTCRYTGLSTSAGEFCCAGCNCFGNAPFSCTTACLASEGCGVSGTTGVGCSCGGCCGKKCLPNSAACTP